jgi:hypothetical protein
MALTFENDTALHEAGHAMIAYLNSDIFEFQYVTSNENFSRMHDSTSEGGLKGRLKKESCELTFEDCDKMFLLFLAGFVADEVNNSECNIGDSFYDNSVWATKMNSIKYSGDVVNYVPFLSILQEKYKVPQRDYTKSCQKLLYDIFTTNWIISLLLDVKKLIEVAENQTITGKDIAQYLDSTKLKDWKEVEWHSIIEARKEEFGIRPEKGNIFKRFFSLFG